MGKNLRMSLWKKNIGRKGDKNESQTTSKRVCRAIFNGML